MPTPLVESDNKHLYKSLTDGKTSKISVTQIGKASATKSTRSLIDLEVRILPLIQDLQINGVKEVKAVIKFIKRRCHLRLPYLCLTINNKK